MEYFIVLSVAVICAIAGFLAGYLIGGQPDSESQDEPASGASDQYPADALHIWQDKSNEQINLQIGRHVFRSTEPLPPTEHKFILQLLTYMQKWLGVYTPADPIPQPAVQPPSQKPQPPVSQSGVSPFVPETPNVYAAEKSIVAQVDDILQEELFNSPLRDKGIRLMENMDGSMRILVGLDPYDDIASIPDETIQAAIRAAVHKWEQRQ